MNRREGEAVDPVAVSEGDGLEVHHLKKAFPPGLRVLLGDPIGQPRATFQRERWGREGK